MDRLDRSILGVDWLDRSDQPLQSVNLDHLLLLDDMEQEEEDRLIEDAL